MRVCVCIFCFAFYHLDLVFVAGCLSDASYESGQSTSAIGDDDHHDGDDDFNDDDDDDDFDDDLCFLQVWKLQSTSAVAQNCVYARVVLKARKKQRSNETRNELFLFA